MLFSLNNLESQQQVRNILSNLVVHYISSAYFPETGTHRLYLLNPVRSKFLSQTNISIKIRFALYCDLFIVRKNKLTIVYI